MSSASAREITFESQLFIDGMFTASKSQETFPLFNPSNGRLSCNVACADAADVDAAVTAAERASKAWIATDAFARARLVNKLADLIEANAKDFAALEALSMGRPVSTYADASEAVKILQCAAGQAHHIHGQSSLTNPGTISMTFKQPYGVTGAIIPWNLPLIMCAVKFGPAVIAGNAMVLKTSEKAPLTSTLFAKLVSEAGFPPGLFNVLHGFGMPCGDAIARHPKIRKISFTGSTSTGKKIARAAAESNMKAVTLELGGKNPLVVFADADIQQAASEAVASGFWNSGQLCMASSRIYVEHSAVAEFKKHYLEYLDVLASAHGDASHHATLLGPQADKLQYDAILAKINQARSDGITFLREGGVVKDIEGCFIQPVVLEEPDANNAIMKEEVFGPVTSISSFSSEDEVIARINDTEYGLYSSIYTRDVNRAMRFARLSESGVVGVNCTSPTLAYDLPFGGYKSSGLGREFGKEGLEAWLETKTVIFKT